MTSLDEQVKEKGKTQSLDLRGIACPLNFVKIKLKLDALSTEEVLEVRIDKEICGNIVRCVKDDGYKVLYAQENNGGYVLGVRR